jgi:hypothetical protein
MNIPRACNSQPEKPAAIFNALTAKALFCFPGFNLSYPSISIFSFAFFTHFFYDKKNMLVWTLEWFNQSLLNQVVAFPFMS